MNEGLPELNILRKNWPEYADSSAMHKVKVRDITIGGPRRVIIAGPCAVESLEQTLTVATIAKKAGAHLLRGGAYKPRTNPHSFQGLGLEGLKILDEVRRQTGLGFVTEVLDPRLVEQVASYADMLQIGSRSMQNFPLLTEVGRGSRPVLLKRGWSATIEEWLCAAEYIAKEGNRNVVLCERGIRTSCHWSYANYLLDLNVIEPLRKATPLPVIVDPSHAAGDWNLVASLSRAAISAGADGLLIEVVDSEERRAELKSDRGQGVPPEVFIKIVDDIRKIEN
ncbi:MAG: 3-deoxy-7-phosphoheptulonate synthase [Acidobacteriota bacterium]